MVEIDLAERITQLERELQTARTKLLELRDQRDLLEMEVDELRINQGKPQVSVENLQEAEKYKAKMEEYFARVSLLDIVIRRYRQAIDQGENKSISDLKTLVQPFHPRIL